jgi:RNA polymerase sigma-70 factor (ECF subfamily)
MTDERAAASRAPSDPPPGVTTTAMLLARARSGDDGAVEALCRRLLPRLNRWAAGRLPRYARSLVDTGDVVQEVLVRTLRHIAALDGAHEGAFAAYLRVALTNRIREELRRARRVPQRGELDTDRAGHEASPLEELIGHDAFDRYEAALAHLAPRDREAIVQRMELGMSHAEVAEALGLPSAEAARKAVSRALLRLAHGMRAGE